MKPKSKMTLWFESQAAKHNLSITTIKNCYAKSDKIRAEYDKLIAEAKKDTMLRNPKSHQSSFRHHLFGNHCLNIKYPDTGFLILHCIMLNMLML